MVPRETLGQGTGFSGPRGLSKHPARTFFMRSIRGNGREGSGEVVLHVSVETQGTDRGDVDAGHGIADGVADERRPAWPYVRRHGADDLQSVVFDAAEALGEKVWKATGKYDISLAVVSAMLVGGFIFNSFAMASYFFALDHRKVWAMGSIGIALWLFALAVFFLFLTAPVPRHRQRR